MLKSVAYVFSILVLLALGPIPVHGPANALGANPSPELLDINSASQDQLKTLPGIGDAYAKKIISNRPYKRKDELLQKQVIPKATYDKVKEKIVAKQQ